LNSSIKLYVFEGGEHEASLVKSYLFPKPKLVVLALIVDFKS
jgi:hypothetical protein